MYNYINGPASIKKKHTKSVYIIHVPDIEKFSGCLGDRAMRAIDEFVNVFAVFVVEHVRMELEDGDDQLDGLHGHVVLLVQGHGHDPILELGSKQLQLAL